MIDYPDIQSCALIFIDMQEKLVSTMKGDFLLPAVKKQKLMLSAAAELDLPVFITEQYPKGLGKTIPEISAFFKPEWTIMEKISFSCFGLPAFRAELAKKPLKSLIISGIETHVCVQQTALDAINGKFQVFLPADTVCSRNETDKIISLDLMKSCGVFVTTAESLIFSLLKDSNHPSFKNISKMLR